MTALHEQARPLTAVTTTLQAAAARRPRSRLFRKFVLLFVALVGGALLASGALNLWFSYEDNKSALAKVQQEKALAAAARIGQFVDEVTRHMGLTSRMLRAADTLEQGRLEILRLLQQAPAITEVTRLGGDGREQLRVSRLAVDVVGSGDDRSGSPAFRESEAGGTWFSPVYFRRESEPYMTVAIAGSGRNSGVTVAELNLKFIWDVISRIEAGQAGYAYVVDSRGWLIAHPDIGLVLRQTDLSDLPQVAAALARSGDAHGAVPGLDGLDRTGAPVLTAHAVIAPLNWTVFVDLPQGEAFAPIYASLIRTSALLLLGLALAVGSGVFLARMVAGPIAALQQGATRIGRGDLGHQISIRTGDELEVLADSFNDMAGQLRESYATLEQKVVDRTNELSEALQQQTATAEVLKVISRSAFDLQSVLDTLTESAAQLCRADMAGITRPVGENYYYATNHNFSPDWLAYVKDIPLRRDRGSIVGRVLLDRDVVQVEDVLADPEYTYADPARKAGYRTFLGVPLLREGEAIGVLVLARKSIAPFADKQIELLVTFADQAVIAIENARLFEEVQARNRELSETLERQAATSEILRAISSSPTDVQPVFETIAQSAARLCKANYCFVFEFDGELIHSVAYHGVTQEGIEAVKGSFPAAPDRGSITGRAVLSGSIEQVPDFFADPHYKLGDIAKLVDYRSGVAIPMMQDRRPVGVITLTRAQTGYLPDRLVELLQTFSEQAVIAVENVRLFTEVQSRNRDLNEALEQQTATADVLKVISRSAFDLQNVLDTLVQSAARLCEADMVSVTRQKADSSFHYHVASHGFSPEWFDYMQNFPLEPDRGTLIGRTLVEGQTVHIPDVLADAEYTATQAQSLGGFRTVLGVPLLREGRIIGVFLIARRAVKPFTAKQIDLVTTFADQAVIAIENVRLFDEVKARNSDLNEALEQQTATSEILRVISSSPTDIRPVFDTIAESAARLCQAQFCFVFRFDGEHIHFVSSHGVAPDGIESVLGQVPAAPGRGSTTSRAILSGRVEQIPDVDLDPEYELGNVAKKAHYCSTVAVPMLRDGRVIGAITVARSLPGLFPERQVELLKAFAGQAVIAVENVRLFTELEARNRDLNEALEQQTATAEILSEISRSPTDIQPVFETIAQCAARLCESQFCFVADYDGALVHFVAQYGIPAETVEGLRRAYPRPPSRASISARTILSGRVEQIPDLDADLDYELHEIDKRAYRSMVGVPILKEGRPIGAFVVGRSQTGLFADRQIRLLETFADQAVIAIENVRLFTEVQARNRDLDEALQQQTATADVLKVISRSTFDLQAVLDALVLSAVRLCEAHDAVILLKEGEWLKLGAHYGPIPLDFTRRPLTRGWTAGRAVMDCEPVHIHDLQIATDEYPEGHELALRLGHRTILSLPLVRANEAIGVLAIRRTEVRPFSEKQIDLLTTFADQALIAIENVRLFEQVQARNRELDEALQQQTATADVLKVISRSTFDLQAVLDTLVESSVRLCDAHDANCLLKDADCLEVRAHHGPIAAGFTRLPISRHWAGGRAVVDRKPIHVHDLHAAPDEFPEGHSMALKMGYRTILSIPLLREDDAIGAISIRRTEVRPFTDKQIDLLTTFADQAVIAIENVRLFDEVQARTRELTAALEQQTATSDILRAISMSPSSVQPVFETIVRNALPLCGSLFANVFRFDGELLHYVASHNIGPDFHEMLQEKYPMRPDSSQVAGRVILTRSVVRLENALEDPDYDQTFPLAMGWRRLLGVPMLREGVPLGVIVVGWAEAGPVSQRQEELLKTFADQAVIAVENVRLFDEVQARTRELAQSVEELRALGEVSQAVNSTLDLETVLNTIVAKAVQLSGTDAGSIYVLNKANTKFKLRATYGMDVATVAAIRHSSVRAGETAIGQATDQRRPLQIADVLDAPAAGVLDAVVQAGYRSILIVPLLGPDRAIGVLVIRRKVPGVFPDSTTDLLQTFAAQSVLAIQNARLFHEIEEKSQQLELASRHKSQFLANMSHELRTPLNAILGYSELVLDDIYGAVPEKARVALERVQSNGKHLLGLINDVLDLAKIEAGKLTLSLADYAMDEVVAGVVAAVEALAAEKQLALTVDVPSDLPIGHGDEQRIRQVLLNLVSNAIKFTDAGEVTVTARVGDGAFQVAVSDTGPGISAEDQAKLFQEFQQADSSSTRTKGGTGLGLAISRRFIDLHGGRIRVTSAPGHGSTFTFELPITVEIQEEVE